MPKPKYRISQVILNALKMKLEDALMFRIFTKPDCKKAATVIQERTKKAISESTIYRLFLWEKNSNSPYFQTLEILTEYIGYPSWVALEAHLDELARFRIKSGVFASSFDEEPYSILFHCIKFRNFEVLHQFFFQFSKDISLEKKLILGEEIYASLYRNPESTMDFYKEFHAVPIVREAFFEYFADPQFKLEHYAEGLNLYLKNIHPLDSIQSLQDYIFANCLLFRHYFFSEQNESLKALGQRLYSDLIFPTEALEQIHIYPQIRYRTYYLFYRYNQVGFDEVYWRWLVDYAIELSKSYSTWEQKIIVHTVLDALQFDEHYLQLTYDIFQSKFTELFSMIPSHLNQRSVHQGLRYLDTNAVQIFD